MRRIRSLMAATFEETSVGKVIEHGGEQAFFSRPSNQAGATFAQDGKVKTGVSQFEPECVLPVNTSAHGIGGLLVGEVLAEWHEGNERQTPRWLAVVPDLRVEVGKEVLGVDDAELVAHGYVPIPFGKGSTSHAGSLFGHRINGTGIE
jgi:hypothetical protein